MKIADETAKQTTMAKRRQEYDGKRMIQRLNEENGRQENTVLSTWSWCKQGWPRLSQMTDHWPRPSSLLLTVLNKYLFNFIKIQARDISTLPKKASIVGVYDYLNNTIVLCHHLGLM